MVQIHKVTLSVPSETHLKMRRYNSLVSWSDIFVDAVNKAVAEHEDHIKEIRNLINCQPVLREALENGVISLNHHVSDLVQDDEQNDKS